jgi:hypothetical protein
MAPSRQVMKRRHAEDFHVYDKMQKLAARAAKRYPYPPSDAPDREDKVNAANAARRAWITKQAPPAPRYRPVLPTGKFYAAHPVVSTPEELEKALMDAVDHMNEANYIR